MSDITLTSEIHVEEIQHCGDDATIVAAARVSTRGWASVPEEESYGLLRSLLRAGHTVPFEHSLLTVRAHCPAFVWWEWTRHRFQPVDVPGLSFSLESGRYRELEPVFWVPRRDRAMVPVEGFKPIRPDFRPVDADLYDRWRLYQDCAYRQAWQSYRYMVEEGMAREVARSVLGFGVYYAGWASGSVLAWLHFLARRTKHPQAAKPSYPQAEIEEAAQRLETIFAAHWPLTHRAWTELGRQAP